MKRFLLFALASVFFVSSAYAYDATFNFSQDKAELVSGFKVKAGGVKGGPYPTVIQCGKPTAKTDGTYDCVGNGLSYNPIYAVVVNYDSAGKESSPSNEGSLSITVPSPSEPKISLKITTVSYLQRGKVVAKTSIAKVTGDVKEGTTSYRDRSGRYITNTVVALN